MTGKGVYRDLASRLRELATEESAGLLRFKVRRANPLVLEQVEGDLLLEDGDPDFNVGDWLKQFQASYGLTPGDLVWVIDAGGEYQAFDVLSASPVHPAMTVARFYIGDDAPSYTDGYFMWFQTYPDSDDWTIWVETEGDAESDGSGRFFVGPNAPGGAPPWAWASTTEELQDLVFYDDRPFTDVTRKFFVGPNRPTDPPPWVWLQTGFVTPDGFTLWLDDGT